MTVASSHGVSWYAVISVLGIVENIAKTITRERGAMIGQTDPTLPPVLFRSSILFIISDMGTFTTNRIGKPPVANIVLKVALWNPVSTDAN